MNERIQALWEQADIKFSAHWQHQGIDTAVIIPTDLEKFAELIIEECAEVGSKFSQAHPEDIRFQIKKHFGQQPGWVCPKCGADRTKIACPLGFGATVDGRCPMIATAQAGVEE